jgi:hypothetical protein
MVRPRVGKAGVEVVMHRDARIFVVIQAGASQACVVKRKAQGADQVKSGACVGTKSDHVAGIGRNFRAEQDDM